MARGQNDYAGGVWIDEAWLDTVVVVGLTCFILCLMGLSKVRFPTAGLHVPMGSFCSFHSLSYLHASLIGPHSQNGHALRHGWYGCLDSWILD
jgi:hypothetical protein